VAEVQPNFRVGVEELLFVFKEGGIFPDGD
jgi:hypothetical protein